MEAVKPWEEVEVEVDEDALRGRMPCQHTTNTTITTTTITTSKDVVDDDDDDDGDTRSGKSSEKSSSDDEANNIGKPTNGVSVSHGENGDAKSTNGHSGLDNRYDDFLVSEENRADQTLELETSGSKFEKIYVVKVEVENDGLPDLTPSASSSSSSSAQKENGKYVSLSNCGTSEREEAITRSRIEEEEEEKEEEKEEELDIERLYNRQGQHEFVCPNCRACITKVLVRQRAPPPPDRVRCTSCFSFLTLAGKIFWPDPDSDPENTSDLEEQLLPDHFREPRRDQSGQAAPSRTPVARQPVAATATTQPLERNSEIQSHQNNQASSAVETPVLEKPIGAVVLTEDKPSSNDPNDITGLQEQVPSRSVTPVPEQRIGTEVNTTKPLPNISDNITGVQEQVPLKDSNGTLHDKKPSVFKLVGAIMSGTSRGFRRKVENNVTEKVPSLETKRPELDDPTTPLLAPEVTVTVTTKAPAPGINLTVSTGQLSIHEGVVPGGIHPNVPGEEDAEGLLDTRIPMPTGEPILVPTPGSSKSWEILKAIVYGGLAESIASLGIVTSAASGDATTLNIVSLALANLLGGLFIIVHNIWELKDDQSRVPCSRTNEQVDRYGEVLGKRHNFILHAFVAILSFIIFGLVPPVVYGFTFRETDDKDLKLAAVAVASLACITLLAVAKAQVQNPHKYFKTVFYYFVIALGVSGVSYLAGEFISQLMEKIESSELIPAFTPPLSGMATEKRPWSSY